ncbi:MAG TPA: group III truncated hemoglobin [Flavobacterium sp.]|uniref:group III truncated hemoglobin n=1 Tax=Flavobacterium sp. TaxID=239 RepID=UPI002B58FF18|nr:group III truncated hemoglobin [Flavobacterium sp.]HPW98721.1 group III truncated hemoglobin [Flavobacterium sp.]HQA74895.1 group III truncated hemoglobin [Flavobacterium sp.]
MKKDIEDKNDIVLLVNSFYNAVQENEILGFIFNDVAKINWDEHLPRMYAFWTSMLLNEHLFSGNPMEKHITLSKITSMTEIQFNEWLLLFTTTVDKLFKGEIANEAKFRAENIARLMLLKIQSV